VGAEVDRLLSAGLEPGQIGIVSLRGQGAERVIHGRTQTGRHAVVRADDPAIIVVDLPEGELGRVEIRLNIAVTRAMAFVRFVGASA